MASHQELADFIKKVHIGLRVATRQQGAEQAWEKHCRDSEILKKYSAAMKELATIYWDKNNEKDPNLNRIWWVVKECESFYSESYKGALDKERKLIKRYFHEDIQRENVVPSLPLKLLDVGSCYNPFKAFSMFDVTAVDIAPASDDVIECDFLSAQVGSPCLPQENFNVILFSFLLEYLPHSKMRFQCCCKAYDLLKPGGILIILTPDSKHDTANSKMMKSWRLGLASVGFLRTNYQKLKHLRCMTFYKCYDPRATREWLKTQEVVTPPEESIAIPQDLNPYGDFEETENSYEERSEQDNTFLAENFADLAGDDLFVQ